MVQLLFILALSVSTQQAFAKAAAKPEVVVVNVKSTPNGFEPNVISADPGKHVKLVVTRNPASSCTSDIRIPEKKISRKLPRKKQKVSIDLGVLEKGTLNFGCGKEMTQPGMIYVK